MNELPLVLMQNVAVMPALSFINEPYALLQPALLTCSAPMTLEPQHEALMLIDPYRGPQHAGPGQSWRRLSAAAAAAELTLTSRE